MANVITQPYSNIDSIAAKLSYFGRLAASMPPAWDGGRISFPLVSGDCRFLGKMLPGRGLYLDMDAKSVGITKPMPYVFERTPVQRLMEKVKNDRVAISMAGMWLAAMLCPKLIPAALFGTITTYDGIIAARAGGLGYDVMLTKVSATTVGNAWYSLFDTAGSTGTGAFTSTPGAVCTRATPGAWSLGLTNPTGSNSAYLLTFGFTAAQQINALLLTDLLVQVGSIAIANGAATVSSAALTRYTNGVGVMATLEVTTILSATNAGNIVMAYTNQAGSGGSSPSTALQISGPVKSLQPTAIGPFVQLASGDYGVRAVSTLTSSSATATTGVVALNLYFPLGMIPGIAANAYIERDSTTQIDGLVQLALDATPAIGCLNAYILPNTTSSGILTAFMRTCQG